MPERPVVLPPARQWRAQVPHFKNAILARASPVDIEDLRPHLRHIELEHGRVLAESRQRVDQVYFPHGGILSCVVRRTSLALAIRLSFCSTNWRSIWSARTR